METPKYYHQRAQRAYETAYVSTDRDSPAYRERLQEALSYEIKAVELLRHRLDDEPTRALLCRSAASIALQLGDYRVAEIYAALGLASNKVPDWIAKQLREVLAEIENHP
jgi:hypothetical protein